MEYFIRIGSEGATPTEAREKQRRRPPAQSSLLGGGGIPRRASAATPLSDSHRPQRFLALGCKLQETFWPLLGYL